MISARYTQILSAIMILVVGVATDVDAQLQFDYDAYDSSKANVYFGALSKGSDEGMDIIDLTIRRPEDLGTIHDRLWRMGGVFAQRPAVCVNFRCPAFEDTFDLVRFSSVDIEGYFERMSWAAPQFDDGHIFHSLDLSVTALKSFGMEISARLCSARVLGVRSGLNLPSGFPSYHPTQQC